MTDRITRLEKMNAFETRIRSQGLGWGRASQFMEHGLGLLGDIEETDEYEDSDEEMEESPGDGGQLDDNQRKGHCDEDDAGADDGTIDDAITSSVVLAQTYREFHLAATFWLRLMAPLPVTQNDSIQRN